MSGHLGPNLGSKIAIGAVVKEMLCFVVKPDVNVGVETNVAIRAISAHELKFYVTSGCC